QELWEIFGAGQPKTLDQVAPALEDFLRAHPQSPWVPSLQANLGRHYRVTGFFSVALDHWEAAWNATKSETGRDSRELAEYALVNRLELLASLGRTETMGALFEETRGRPILGPFRQPYNQFRDAYNMMLGRPDIAYRCGTFALNAVAKVLYGTNDFPGIIDQ